MNIKTVNEIFGYGLFGIGALKIVFTILVFFQMITNVNIALNGGDGTDYGYYPTFSVILGGAQILLAIGSIIMILVNFTIQPKVIPGYLWGLGAILIELIIPSSLYIFVLFAECGMYMKAGQKIRSNNEIYKDEFKPKTSKKTIKNTEWFYNNQNTQNSQNDVKKQKKIEKIEKELYEWKQLLDSGEIDEEIYNAETNRLIEKERRINERGK